MWLQWHSRWFGECCYMITVLRVVAMPNQLADRVFWLTTLTHLVALEVALLTN